MALLPSVGSVCEPVPRRRHLHATDLNPQSPSPKPLSAMKLDHRTLSLAARAGALTGIRSMSALTAVSQSLSGRSRRPKALPARLLASPFAPIGLKLAAAGELVADKLPFLPARTRLAPLLGRVAFAALASASAAQARKSAILPAVVVAGLAAAATATMATTVRRLITDRLPVPGLLVGLAEDAIVVSGAARLARALE